jgi:hypothetical protein
MKTKIRAIITKLRGIEDDLIDLLSEPEATTLSPRQIEPERKIESHSETATALLNVIGKDSFHELSEALAKANGIDIRDVGKHIHYGVEPKLIKFSHAGRIDELEIPILDEERIDTGFNLDFDEIKAIPHIPQVEDLAAAIGTKDHPDWFKKQKADLEARITPHNWLTEPILTDGIKQLSTEELEAQIAKVIHLKEIAAQHGFVRSTQKGKPKYNNSKDVGGPVKPPKPVARMAPKTSDLKGG